MAVKKFPVKVFNGKITKAGNPSYNKLDAKCMKVLDVLNNTEGRPEIYKDVPSVFERFYFKYDEENEKYTYFQIRLKRGEEVTNLMQEYVKDVLEPGWNEKVEAAFDFKALRRNRKGLKEEVIDNIKSLAVIDDGDSRAKLVDDILTNLGELVD